MNGAEEQGNELNFDDYFTGSGVETGDYNTTVVTPQQKTIDNFDVFFSGEGVEVSPAPEKKIEEYKKGELGDVIVDDIMRGIELTGERAYDAVTGIGDTAVFMVSAMGVNGFTGIAMATAQARGESPEVIEDFQAQMLDDYMYAPRTPVGQAVEGAFTWVGEKLHHAARFMGDYAYNYSQAVGLPDEVSSGAGAGVTASVEVFSAPFVAKGVSVSAAPVTTAVKGAIKGKNLSPRQMYREHRRKMDERLKDKAMQDLIDDLAAIENVEKNIQSAIKTEQRIPGYKADLAEATQSKIVQERKQALLNESETARSRSSALEESNRNAVAAFTQRVFGEPDPSVYKIVEAANGKVGPILTGFANELKQINADIAKIRVKMETKSTPELGADLLNSIERRYKFEHAVEKGLWEVIGDAPIEFGNVYQLAQRIKAQENMWNKGEFPASVDKVIARFRALESEKQASILAKQTEIAELQRQRAGAVGNRMGASTNIDEAIAKAQQELVQIQEAPIKTAIPIREAIDFKRDVNTAWNIERNGSLTRPNAPERGRLLSGLIGEFEKSIDNLSKSTNKDVATAYNTARMFTQRVKNQYTKGPIGDMRMPGDVLNEVRMSVEAIAERAFKKAAGKTGGVNEFRKVLDVLPENGAGFTILKEIVTKKFADKVLDPKTGEIVPAKVQRFMTEYGEMLELVKPWKNELMDLASASDTIQWMREQVISRKNMTENMFIMKLLRPAEGETAASAFEKMVQKPGAVEALITEARSMGLPREAVSRAFGSMILKNTHTATPDGKFSINTGAAYKYLRENGNLLRKGLTQDHYRDLVAIFRAETGHNLFKTMYKPVPGQQPTLIGKLEGVTGKSARSYGTDYRAYTQGRTSKREIFMSTLINTYGRMNKTQVNAIMELALFDKDLSSILANIIKRREAGKDLTGAQVMSLNKKLKEMGQLRRIMAPNAAQTAAGVSVIGAGQEGMTEE